MLEVSPGLIRLTAPDLNRRERAANRRADAPLMVSESELFGTEEEEPAKRGMVTCWTRKSRALLVASLAELDLAPMMMGLNDPAMVTLTYPKAWEVVAPDGESVKKHLDQFRKRYERAWGHRLVCVWKMEFQRRGAPHFHLEMAPPGGLAGEERRRVHGESMRRWELEGGPRPRWRAAVGDGLPFQEWLSLVWADIVDHPDPVERMKHEGAGTRVDYAEGDRGRDPKRLAVYFGKHGMYADKEYQHDVPELWQESGKSVGRFWGYWGLSKVKGAAVLDFDSMIFLGRVLRRYGTTARVWNPDTGAHEFRPVLVHVSRPRRRVAPDGTVRPARHVGGAWVEDAEGVPVDAVHYRRQTVRARRMTGPMGAGFLLVNDGPAMARVLARALEACRVDAPGRPPAGMRGSVMERGACAAP